MDFLHTLVINHTLGKYDKTDIFFLKKYLVAMVTGICCFSTQKANFTILAYEFCAKVDRPPRKYKEEFVNSCCDICLGQGCSDVKQKLKQINYWIKEIPLFSVGVFQ